MIRELLLGLNTRSSFKSDSQPIPKLNDLPHGPLEDESTMNLSFTIWSRPRGKIISSHCYSLDLHYDKMVFKSAVNKKILSSPVLQILKSIRPDYSQEDSSKAGIDTVFARSVTIA